MKIIFNNSLGQTEQIPDDGVMLLKSSSKTFDDNFYLGGVSSRSFELQINKDYITHYDYPIVTIYDDENIIYATLNVDKLDTSAKDVYKYELLDNIVKFDFNYDASAIFVDGKTTLKNILQNMCDLAGVTLATTTFNGENMEVSWYDNRITARDYLSMIAEVNGGFARINKAGELELVKYQNVSSATIDLDECEDYTIGEYHKITRVVFDNGLFISTYGDTTGDTIYLNIQNVYINDNETVEMIYNSIKDFEFYCFKTTNNPIPDVLGGDIVTFSDETNDYQTIAQYDTEYFGKWNGHYELDIKTLVQQETSLKTNTDKYKTLRIEQDRSNAQLTIVSESVDEQNDKIAQVSQTVDELNSKIQDIADITISGESEYATFTLENVNESEPIMIKVKPINSNNNISYLYPRSNLYPSNTLYSTTRTIRFENTSTNEIIDYELPDDLLYYDSNNYDEFYLDYDSQTCQISKKCKYNADGTIVLLETPEVVDYIYPTIQLTDGDYTLSLLGYANAYLFVRLMASNIYTSQFATRVEVSSQISQTATEINLEVAKKTNKDEIISTINQTAEQIKIQANKISLDGKQINLTGENISIASTNFNVDKNGNVTANNASFTNGNFSGTITGSTINGANININTDNVTQGFKVYSNNNASSFEIKSMLAQAQYQGQQTIAMGFGTGSVICKSLQASNGALIAGTNFDGNGLATNNIIVYDDLSVYGSKNRIVDIENDKKVKLNAYETATPYFGDIGSNKTNSKGECKIEIDKIFAQTIEKDDYKVFIQECGDGHLWVEKYKDYFIVKGTPEIEFDWEVKAIQKGYSNIRLEEFKKEELKNEK